MVSLVVLSILLPMIDAFVLVKVHRNALFYPYSGCSLLRNMSLSTDDSMQTCIWQCAHQQHCQTIVYDYDASRCVMFAEVVTSNQLQSSGTKGISVVSLLGIRNPIVGSCSSSTAAIEEATTTSSTTFPPSRIEWLFDGDATDLYNEYNGTVMNNALYLSPGYNGQGSALSLDGSRSQYVLFPKFKNLTYSSFTWQLWVFSSNLPTGDHVMLGLCQSPTLDLCLYLMIRQSNLYFAFQSDDCGGTTTILTNRWHHFAFVYDYPLRTQSIYLNGLLECTNSSRGPFLASSGAMTIGAINDTSSGAVESFWTGYIDQVSYVAQAKSAEEILPDATLVAYFPFDDPPDYHLDMGPNKMKGTSVNLTPTINGIDQGIVFNSTLAYFEVPGFNLLGTPGTSYSIAIWVKKTSGAGTIVHFSNSAAGWCFPLLGLSASNEIIGQNWNNGAVSVTGPVLPLNAWTHLVTCYSPSTGVSLWVNGTLIGSSAPFMVAVPSAALDLRLGTPSWACSYGGVQDGQFYGMMDELRVYSRELNSSEIYSLAYSRH